MDEYYVYILYNLNNRTYVGMTNNLPRRIRQHNGIISGGARYTTSNKNYLWHYHTIIENLNKHDALSIEKKIKIYSRKCKGTSIDKRMNALKLLNLIS